MKDFGELVGHFFFMASLLSSFNMRARFSYQLLHQRRLMICSMNVKKQNIALHVLPRNRKDAFLVCWDPCSMILPEKPDPEYCHGNGEC